MNDRLCVMDLIVRRGAISAGANGALLLLASLVAGGATSAQPLHPQEQSGSRIGLGGRGGERENPESDPRATVLRFEEDVDRWSPGFRNAGQRVISSLGRDRFRLEYTLATHASASEVNLGEIGFLEKWLLESLKREFPLLDSAEVVDRGVARTDGETVSRVNERLIFATGSRSSVERAEVFLDALRQKNAAEVELQILLLSRKGSPASPEAEVTALDREEFAAKLGSIRKGGAEILADLRVVARGAEKALSSSVQQIACVTDWEIETLRDAILANPVVSTLQEGYLLAITPILSGGEKGGLILQVDLQLNSLKRPIPELTTSLGKGMTPVTVQLPELSTLRVNTEALSLGVNEEGVFLKGPGYVRWSEGGISTPYTIEALIRAVPRAVASRRPLVARVLGFDPENKRVFAKMLGEEPRPDEELEGFEGFEIFRGNTVVGRCRVSERTAELMVVELIEGTARAGDLIR